MTRRSGRLVLVAALLSAPVGAAQAREAFVFSAFNQATLARHAPLPAPETAQPDVGLRQVLDWTNEFVIKQSGGETLRLDGESLRVGFQQRWRLGEALLGIEVPLLVSGGGVLDSGIENWHSWFGLPNGGREQLPRNEYRYYYVRDGQAVFDLQDGGARLGDIRLSAGRCVASGGCWRSMLQLPTGDADRLFGGGLGLSGWYERAWAVGAGARWSGVVAAGISGLRRDGPLRAQQEAVVPFGWLSLGYALTDALDAGLQFYGHGRLYDDSRLDVLTKPGGTLVFGFRYRTGAGTQWRLGIQEDPITDSSPDFVIHLSVDWAAAQR